MSALGVLDSLGHSRRSSAARGDSSAGDWREQDSLLMVVAAVLLAEGKDGPLTRQVLARLSRRGLMGEVLALLARSDPGAASLAAQLAARLDPAASRAFHATAAAPRAVNAEEETALAEWLRLAASAVESILNSGEDRHLRSRLALAWGRLSRIAAEGEAWLDDSDSRVRANAVESLWGRGDEAAVKILFRKLDDPHHRVAANAAVGLYLAGRPESISALYGMARHEDNARRAAAVWAMGRTGDARFLPLLTEMRKSKAAPVSLLRNVVLARERIRQAEELPREDVEIRLDGVSQRGELRLMAQLSRRASGAEPPLRPTDFALECDGRIVWDYRAWRSALAGPDALALIVPGQSEEQARTRAEEIASAAGEAVRALLRLALGYEDRAPDPARAGEILGLSSGSSGGEWFAAGPPAWNSTIRRAAENLAANHGNPCVVIVVERGAPEWLAAALAASARDRASLGLRLAVLHEPAALDSTLLETVRAAGGDAVPAPGGDFAAALRGLMESPAEIWCVESSAVRAEEIRHLRLILRSGWLHGEAEVRRAS